MPTKLKLPEDHNDTLERFPRQSLECGFSEFPPEDDLLPLAWVIAKVAVLLTSMGLMGWLIWSLVRWSFIGWL